MLVIIQKIIKIIIIILIFRFFFIRQINNYNNITIIPNLINFFTFKFSDWFIKPFNFIIKIIYEKKEWMNFLVIIFFVNIYTILCHCFTTYFNMVDIFIIDFFYLTKFFLFTTNLLIIIENILIIVKPSSNLNDFFYLLNLNNFIRFKRIKINKFIYMFSIDQIFYFLILFGYNYIINLIIKGFLIIK